MTTKKKLQTFFDARHDDAKYIQTYEENLEFFGELLRTGRSEELDFVLPIKLLKYADPLNQTGQYSKALKVLHEVEQDLSKLKGRSKWYEQYEESLMFLKGVCLSRLKRYKQSNQQFGELLSRSRVNENYLNWYRSNRKALIDRYSWPILIGGVAAYLVLQGMEWLDFGPRLPLVNASVLAIGLLALVIPAILKFFIDRSSPPTLASRE